MQQTQAINGRSIMFTIIDDKMMQKYKQLKLLMLSKTTWMASSDRPITDFPMWNSKKRFQQFEPLSTQWFIWKPKPDIMIHYRCRARLKRFKHFRNQANAKFMNVSLTVDIGINYPYIRPWRRGQVRSPKGQPGFSTILNAYRVFPVLSFSFQFLMLLSLLIVKIIYFSKIFILDNDR